MPKKEPKLTLTERLESLNNYATKMRLSHDVLQNPPEVNKKTENTIL